MKTTTLWNVPARYAEAVIVALKLEAKKALENDDIETVIDLLTEASKIGDVVAPLDVLVDEFTIWNAPDCVVELYAQILKSEIVAFLEVGNLESIDDRLSRLRDIRI